MKNLLTFLVIIIALSSCNTGKWITAEIQEGKHRSSLRSRYFAKKQMAFEVVFEDSNRTDTTVNFVNKFAGRSDGIYHMWNSPRIGYRYLSEIGKVGIYGFSHIDNQFYFDLIDYAEIGEAVTVGYKITSDQYLYYYKDKILRHERSQRLKWLRFVGYTLRPYFGGSGTAPHGMKIKFRVIDWPFNDRA